MKPIAHYETRYAVCKNGIIINLANNTVLKAQVNQNGYLRVGLANGDGTHWQTLVHILVARHFLPNPYEYTQVNHIDGNKQNCSADNLEWVSASENIEHAFRTGLRPGYMPADEKEVLLSRALSGEQIKDLAKEIGRRPETLHKMLRVTADRLGVKEQWDTQMKENRRNVAIRLLNQINH